MAKVHARNVAVYGGARDISGRSNQATLTQNADTPDVTAFQDPNRERLSQGIRDIELTLSGWMDVAASQVDQVMSTLLNASAYWGLYPEGAGASKTGGREFIGILSEYSQDYATDAAAAISATVGASGAVTLTQSLGQITISSGTASTTLSVNNGASSTSALCFFRVLELDGTTPDISACVQHSGDDVTFTTAASFAAASSASQIFTTTISNGASQYRRIRYDLNGTSPSAKIFISTGSYMS